MVLGAWGLKSVGETRRGMLLVICNVFKRSLKSQILLAQSLKNCLTQADAHLLWVLAPLRCSPSFLGKAPPSLMLSVASDVHLGNLSPLVAISTQHTHFKISAIQWNFQHQRDHGKTEWSDHSIPGKSLWSFCDSSVTLFKVKWPPTRGFKGHIVSAGISQSYLCLLPGLTSCGLCSIESEPRKPKSGRPCILGNNSSLCHFSVPALATSAGWLVILDGLSQSFAKN